MQATDYYTYSATRSVLRRYYETLVRLDVSALALDRKEWQPGLPSPQVVQRLQVRAAEVGRVLRELSEAERIVVELGIAHPHRPTYAPSKKESGKRRDQVLDKVTMLSMIARNASYCLMCGHDKLRWNVKHLSRSCKECGFSDRWHSNKYYQVLDVALGKVEELLKEKGLI